ncbi:hypothetical protein T492DRAFT_836858 [Pavlovales sp. CCMP2436]|nr:hypothetical protein T492DRAFT_836858 [Pavlovales sp. CCMP2436]
MPPVNPVARFELVELPPLIAAALIGSRRAAVAATARNMQQSKAMPLSLEIGTQEYKVHPNSRKSAPPDPVIWAAGSTHSGHQTNGRWRRTEVLNAFTLLFCIIPGALTINFFFNPLHCSHLYPPPPSFAEPTLPADISAGIRRPSHGIQIDINGCAYK